MGSEEIETGFAQDDMGMVDRIQELQGRLSEIVAHLKEIEWSAEWRGGHGNETDRACPACHNPRWVKHKPDCWLARAIGGGDDGLGKRSA